MTCEQFREQFWLYLYGELSFDQEELLESHLEQCAPCGLALAREREVHAAFDAAAQEPAASALWDARRGLFEKLREEAAPKARIGWWDRLVDSITFRPSIGWARPAGALALVALGFFAGQQTPFGAMAKGTLGLMSMGEPAASRVRFVDTGSDGDVRIVLDETRQRTITGGIGDKDIRAWLLSAAKDPSDPGLRAETLSILNTGAKESDIQGALLYALQHDDNAGVRLRAMEGLRPFAHQAEVQTALAHVLLNDTNPGVRTQAIDLLTTGAETDRDREIVGTLQELMRRESNDYVRQRSEHLLETMNASAEIY